MGFVGGGYAEIVWREDLIDGFRDIVTEVDCRYAIGGAPFSGDGKDFTFFDLLDFGF